MRLTAFYNHPLQRGVVEMKGKLKGFTIVEMVVVIAIIGILAGVLTLNMSAYYRQSRIKASNADAKLVYNAAQTEAQRYISVDRTATTASVFAGKVVIYYNSNGTVSCAGVDGTTADNLKPVTSLDSAYAAQGSQINALVAAVNRTVSGASEVCWAVYVDNYIVKSAASATHTTTNCIGTYSRSAVNRASATDYGSQAFAAYMTTGSNLTGLASLCYDVTVPTEAPTT